MRLRYVIVVSTIGLATAWVPFAAPASAATTTAVVSATGLPSNLGIATPSCTQGDGYGTVVHVAGPSAPPSGTGSLELLTTDEQIIAEDFTNPIDATTLSELSTGYLNPQGNAAALEIQLNTVTSDTGFDVDVVNLPLGTTSSWVNGDLTTAELHTYHVSSANGKTDSKTQTWAQFQSDKPGSQINEINVTVDRCTGTTDDLRPSAQPGQIYIDNLQVGVSNAITAYDFEAAPTAATVSLTAPATATAGSVTISGTVRNGSKGISGQRVTLLSKMAGSSTWKTAAVVTSTSTGVVRSKQKITARTSYKWSYAGDQDVGGATSSAKTVKLVTKTAVSINAAARTLAKHAPVTLFGQITPAKTGVTITVYDRVGKHARKLGHTKTKARGEWGFSHSLAKGAHHLYAKVAAFSGHLGGHVEDDLRAFEGLAGSASPTRGGFVRIRTQAHCHGSPGFIDVAPNHRWIRRRGGHADSPDRLAGGRDRATLDDRSKPDRPARWLGAVEQRHLLPSVRHGGSDLDACGRAGQSTPRDRQPGHRGASG
jgi:hypothetical protein